VRLIRSEIFRAVGIRSKTESKTILVRIEDLSRSAVAILDIRLVASRVIEVDKGETSGATSFHITDIYGEVEIASEHVVAVDVCHTRVVVALPDVGAVIFIDSDFTSATDCWVPCCAILAFNPEIAHLRLNIMSCHFNRHKQGLSDSRRVLGASASQEGDIRDGDLFVSCALGRDYRAACRSLERRHTVVLVAPSGKDDRHFIIQRRS